MFKSGTCLFGCIPKIKGCISNRKSFSFPLCICHFFLFMRFRNAVLHKECLSGFVIFRTGSEFLSLLLPRHIAHARIISDFFSKSLCLSVVLVHRRQKQEMEYVKLDVRVAILIYFKRKAHRLARNQ